MPIFEVQESTRHLLENLYQEVAQLKVKAGWSKTNPKVFGNSLKSYLKCYPVGHIFERYDEPRIAMQSFVDMPEVLREWVGGMENNKVWNYGWTALSSLVLSEAQNLLDSIDNLVERSIANGELAATGMGENIKNKITHLLESSDLPSGSARFKNNPTGAVVTNAHENIKEIIRFLDNLKDQGEVNLFDALLNKDNKNKVTAARKGEGRLRDEFFRTINQLETEDEAPENSNELINRMAERFEKLSTEGRKRSKRLADSMNSLVGSLEVPAVKNRLESVFGSDKKISKFKQYAESLSDVARQMHDLAGQVIELKNASGKKKTERQKTWNFAKELTRKSFLNPSKMGRNERDIDVNSVLNDLKEVDKVLDQAREELVPQYRNSKKKIAPVINSSQTEEPISRGESPSQEDLSQVAPPGTIGKKVNTEDNPHFPDGSESYTAEQATRRLGLNSTDELKDLVSGLFSKSIRVIKSKNHKLYYNKDDVDKMASRIPSAPKEMPPDPEEKPEPEEPTVPTATNSEPPTPELVPTPHFAPPPIPQSRPANITDPDWEETKNSANAEQAFMKPVSSENLKKQLDRTGIFEMPSWASWITGKHIFSTNPWLFYLALRGNGDESVNGQELEQRLEYIFSKASEDSNYDPWNLLKAYERLRSYVASYHISDGPEPKEVAQFIAKHPPEDIVNVAKGGKLIRNDFIRGPQFTSEVNKIKGWLDKIPYPEIKSMAAHIILARIPGTISRYFQGKI